MKTQSPDLPHSSSTETQPSLAYQRALDVFFDGEELSEEQKKQLPTQVEGLSTRREQAIKDVFNSKNQADRIQALQNLRLTFGLPQDIRILVASLIPSQDALMLDALQHLTDWLSENQAKPFWIEKIRYKLKQIEIRSFDAHVIQKIKQCRDLLK